MEFILEENSLNEFTDQDIPMPPALNAQNMAEWKKCVARASWIIFEGVRDHIVSSLHWKEKLHAMWKTLNDPFQNSSDERKLALKDKPQKIKMEVGD